MQLMPYRVIFVLKQSQSKIKDKGTVVQHFLIIILLRGKYSSYYKLLLKRKKGIIFHKQAKVIQGGPHLQTISKQNLFYHISQNRIIIMLVVQSQTSNKFVMWQKATVKIWSVTFQIKRVESQFLVILWCNLVHHIVVVEL